MFVPSKQCFEEHRNIKIPRIAKKSGNQKNPVHQEKLPSKTVSRKVFVRSNHKPTSQKSRQLINVPRNTGTLLVTCCLRS